MRIVEYNGVPVKRQKRVGKNLIRVTFYDGQDAILVTFEEWQKNSNSRYFDDPTIRRRDVVHKLASTAANL